jgi:hypothetical protein
MARGKQQARKKKGASGVEPEAKFKLSQPAEGWKSWDSSSDDAALLQDLVESKSIEGLNARSVQRNHWQFLCYKPSVLHKELKNMRENHLKKSESATTEGKTKQSIVWIANA